MPITYNQTNDRMYFVFWKSIDPYSKIGIINHSLANKNLNEVIDNKVGTLNLKSNLNEKKGQLIVHIDIRAMYLCLIRKKVWNGTIGALCLFERYPNIFYPSVTFSLNYLIINESQKKELGL